MNIKLIFPPQWWITQPYLSLPCLTAYLKKKGFQPKQEDLNIMAYDIFLTPEYLTKCLDRIVKRKGELEMEESLLKKDWREYCGCFLSQIHFPEVINEINEAKAVLREPQKFFNFSLYSKSLKIIVKALKMISTAYYPTVIDISSFEMNPASYTMDDVINATKDEKNPYISFYKDYFLSEVQNELPDLIGISIIGTSQLIPGLTLARIIKEYYPGIHIVIGGNIFSRLGNRLKEWPFIFGSIIDSVILYEGEVPLSKLCETLSKNKDLDEVPNLVFKKNGRVKINKIDIPEKIDCLPTPCFEDLDFDKYFSPYPILPLLSSRGCYWGHCAFCDHGEIYMGRYKERDVDLLIDDISVLSKRYSSKYFTFNDEAIAPSHIKKIANSIISKNIDIRSITDMRLESGITSALAQLIYDSGFRVIYFGLESYSDRVLAHMKKGINCRTIRNVFRWFSDAGIWNHAFLFFGFPTETESEARKTMDFISKNKDIIHSVGHGSFLLTNNSDVMKNPKRYGVSSIAEDPNSLLGLWKTYSVSNGLTKKQAIDLAKKFSKKLEEEYNDIDAWGTLLREHQLLYLDKYGRQIVRKSLVPSKPILTQPKDIHIEDTSIPKLLSCVRFDISKFDVAKIMNEDTDDRNLKEEYAIILHNCATGITISITPSAADIVSLFNGSNTFADVVCRMVEKYKIPIDKIRNDCKKIIEDIIDKGLCEII